MAEVEITSPEIEAFAPGEGISYHGICGNQALVKIDWRFTTADARIKLKRLYPFVK